MDYFDIVVHIFNNKERKYYGLERLWADAPVKIFSDEIPEKKNNWSNFFYYFHFVFSKNGIFSDTTEKPKIWGFIYKYFTATSQRTKNLIDGNWANYFEKI